MRPVRPDSAGAMTLGFRWPGFARPPAAEERSAVALGERLLARVREACAPGSPSEVRCEFGNWRDTKPCRAAT